MPKPGPPLTRGGPVLLCWISPGTHPGILDDMATSLLKSALKLPKAQRILLAQELWGC
jgi:hypothetical protein